MWVRQGRFRVEERAEKLKARTKEGKRKATPCRDETDRHSALFFGFLPFYLACFVIKWNKITTPSCFLMLSSVEGVDKVSNIEVCR